MLFFRRSRAREYDPYKLATPQIYLWRMIIFLIIAGFITLILYRQVYTAFLSNPGLNAVIILVLAFGIGLAFRQVLRLYPEIRWVNTFRIAEPGIEVDRTPILLAPMATSLATASAAWPYRRRPCDRSSTSFRCASTKIARCRATSSVC